MLTGENWACKKDFCSIRKHRTPSIICFTKPERISLASQLPYLPFFFNENFKNL